MAGLPVGQPIGAENLILIEQVRNFAGELVTAGLSISSGHESSQRRKDVVVRDQLWQ